MEEQKVFSFKVNLKNAWNSTNFWIWVGMFLATIFINASVDESLSIVTQVVNTVFASVSAVMMGRNYIKDKGIKFSWSNVTNAIGYLGLIINSLTAVDIPEAFWVHLKTITNGLIAGDWPVVAGAVFPLLVILLNLFKKQTPVEPAK